MQMTHFFFHDHDATQSECAHRLLRTNNYLSPGSQGRGVEAEDLGGGGGHMVFRDHEGKGRISRLYQSFWNGELQKTDHQWGGIIRILQSFTGSGKFCCGKIKIYGLLTQPPPPPAFRDKWWLVPWDVSKCKWAKKKPNFVPATEHSMTLRATTANTKTTRLFIFSLRWNMEKFIWPHGGDIDQWWYSITSEKSHS